jgi:serine/threonine-protein kinase
MAKRRNSRRRRSQAREAAAAARAAATLSGRCGRYEVLQRLGVGGMAEVFKARMTGPAGFRRDVVLKRLLSATNDDQEFVNMFADEARILGALNHPNIVQAVDYSTDGLAPFLVLEYVEGPSLWRVLRRGWPVAPAIVAYIGREICRALDHVHGAADADGTPLRLVHRDVTPSNVIVTPAGAVKLIDFGVARSAKALQSTRAGVVKGKSAYLAPEQLTAETEIDGRVDLFALGTVLYELLTADHLFTGDSDLATLHRVLHLKIPAPSRRNPAVPRALERIVMRALERNPARRYASAAAMARDLDDVVLAAGLRVEDVASFVRDVERGTPGSCLRREPAGVDNDLPTRRDLFMPARVWIGGRFSARRAALVTGLGLALCAAGAFGWGLKPHVARARPVADALVTTP